MSEIAASEPETARDDFPKQGYLADWRGPWGGADEQWFEIVLYMVDHFDHPHDPIECQRKLESNAGRAEWRFLREEERKTLRELGQLLDVDPGSISRWESGNRWPENVEYEMWLKEVGDRLGEQARLQVFLLQSKRDGWHTDVVRAAKSDPILDRFVHWEIIFKDGGLFDRWRESGTLPSWSPADAGFGG